LATAEDSDDSDDKLIFTLHCTDNETTCMLRVQGEINEIKNDDTYHWLDVKPKKKC
ncbi:hypothetical protein BaRGS_00040018, partial [Batillaria attramentaria]